MDIYTIEGKDTMHTGGKGKLILIGFLFLAVLLLCVAAAAEETDENLLYNGDFEILDEEGLPDGWFTDAWLMDPGYTLYGVTEGMGGSGTYAVSVNNTAKNDARFAQQVDVEPETMYCLSGYVRADGIMDGLGANLSVEGVYAFSEKAFDTDGKWKYIEYYGETGPDQHEITVFARVGGYSGTSKGFASFDNLKLTKAESLPQGVYADLWYTPKTDVFDEDDETEWDDSSATGKAGPAWPGLLVVGLLYCVIVAAVVYYQRDGKRETLADEYGSGEIRCTPFLFLALGLRIILSYFVEGYAVDVNCFVSWGSTMKQAGPVGFYLQTSFCDYPPLYMYVLGLNSWLTTLLNADAGWTRVIFRFFPSLCDIAGCWLLMHLPKDRFPFTQNRYYKLIILLLAYNPVTVLNSAAWGQMDSVLCLLLLCVAVNAIEGKWIHAVLFYVTAVLVKPQALMLGILGLTFMVITAVRDRSSRKQILIGLAAGTALIALLVIPFGLRQQTGWLVSKYADTLTSYPYATVNTANLYYITGGNWKGIDTAALIGAPLFCSCACLIHGLWWYMRNKKLKLAAIELIGSVIFTAWFAVCAAIGASWAYVGTAAMAYSFVIVLSMAIRKQDIRLLPYFGALLFILLYVFGVKMHERYLFPAFLLLLFAWTVHRDRRILYLLLFFSLTVFLNEGIVLDNSIRLGSLKGHLNEDTVWLADILSAFNIAGAIFAVYLGYELIRDHAPGGVRRFPQLLPVRTVTLQDYKSSGYHPDSRLHWTIRDTVIVIAITAVYAVVSLTTLGSMKAPQTSWSSSGEEEQIVFELQENQNDVCMLYFGQVSRYDFTVAQSDDGINWSEEIYAQMDQGQCWKWKYVTQSYESDTGKRTYNNNAEYIYYFHGRYIRITSQQVGLVLNEVLFRDADGNIIPASIVSRTGDNHESVLWSEPENLLDEQETLEKLPGMLGAEQDGAAQPSWWNSTYFDEIYHARTGFEFLNGTTPYETSHPPLGKVLISWCIAVFGMTPFGWRFAGALAGILMLPGIYLLGKQLTKKTWPAAFACLLMALDCMHLTQTQIATIDSFPVLFIMFAFFFMLRFIQTDLSRCTLKQALFPLAFSGTCMGLAVASKWIGIYAGIGLAILYFWHCIRHIRMSRTDKDPDTHDMYQRTFVLSLWCLLFFVAIPIAIYLMSYIPYMAYNTRIRSVWDYLAAVWRSQESMLSYHSTPGLGMDHPFYSPWWEWPIIGKPMFYATEQYIASDANLHHSIFCFGNPVVWWGALGALAVVLVRWIRGKHYLVEGTEEHWHLTSLSGGVSYTFVFIGLLAQYLPWVLVPRGTYIYHYFASVPFLILVTMLCLSPENCKRFVSARRIIAVIWIVLAAVLFILLLPYVTGMAVPSGWLNIGKQILRIWY